RIPSSLQLINVVALVLHNIASGFDVDINSITCRVKSARSKFVTFVEPLITVYVGVATIESNLIVPLSTLTVFLMLCLILVGIALLGSYGKEIDSSFN